MLLISSKVAGQSTTPCNSFPKIFGGGPTGGTAINQIDIYKDYLAFGADLCDDGLTGTGECVPYLALSSVSIGGKYFWAKALTQKTDSSFDGLQFSTDGALIIGHIGSWKSTTTTCFVVFNMANGNILSARRYSDGGHQNYNYQMKSMIVSSGASPMAYVLSDYKTTASCTGQHFFKFNPLTFLTTPVWIKKTIGSDINSCGHLGLVFGKNQNFLYAFSWYNGQSVLSLIDTNGNAIWQQQIQGHLSGPNILKYKQIDAQNDMIISTIGGSYRFYYRILSSSASSYSVTETNQFFDPSFNLHAYALYIIDQNKIVSLVYDDPNQDTYLASIDFFQSKISYQRAFPKIYKFRSAIFTSPTVFYASSFHNNFYKDLSYDPAQTFSTTQAIIYSSDQLSTSCYSIAPYTTPITSMIKVSGGITSLTTSIYEGSSVSFVSETQALQIADINQDKLSKLNFCPIESKIPFTTNSVIQSNTSFSVAQGVSDVQLPITPFSANLNCGSYANTWTYAGFDNTDNHMLINETDLMSVDSTTGSIFVSKLKPNGTYIVKVVGTLTDFVTTSQAIFTINMNTVPVFETNLTDITVPLMSTVNYPFPTIIDLDYGATASVSVVKDNSTNEQPDFITKASTHLIINPNQMIQVKEYTMIVIITDTKDTKEYSFIMNVTNQPPKLTSQIQSPFLVNFGHTTTYKLPSSIDPEGLTYSTTMISRTPFVEQISSTELSINPTNCTRDFGNFTIQMKLEDTYPLSIFYQFDIIVINLPPLFSGSSTQSLDQIVEIKCIQYQNIPSFLDPEGCPITFSISPVILQQFVKIDNNKIVYSPNKLNQLGKSNITLICSDHLGLSVQKTFNLIVYQKPKFASSLMKQIDLISNKLRNYTLPVIDGITDEYVTHSPNLPRFVRFYFPTYQFLPNQVSQLGITRISGWLKNTYSNISFFFELNVTNYPPYLKNQTTDQILLLNSQLSYIFPEAADREDQTIIYSAHEVGQIILPPFAKFFPQTREFLFSPTKLDSCKNYSIQLDIEDSFGASSSSTFIVSLYNASYYLKLLIRNQNNSKSKTGSASSFDFTTLTQKMNEAEELETHLIGFEIIKVTRDQKATLKIKNFNVQKSYISELLGQITNQSFQVQVIQQQLTSDIIPFQIISKDSSNFVIQLSLKYPNPQNLSIKLPDILRIKSINRIQILKKHIQAILPENTQSESSIPPQATNKLEQAASNAVQGGRIDYTGDTTSNLVIGFAIQMAWIQLEDISFLAVNSMLTISVPGIPSIIQGVMIKYMYFDILYTELWMDEFMSSLGIDLEKATNDTAINIQFSENGFNSKQFLKNSGSSLIFLMMYMIGWIVLLFLSLLSRFSNHIAALKQKLARQLMWKQSINFMISQFPPLFLCSLINLQDLRFKEDSNLFQFSTYISIIVVISLIIALVLIFIRVWKLTRILNNELVSQFNEKYQPLSESLRQTFLSKLILFWKPLYLLRWALTLLTLIAFQDKPSLQMMTLLFLSFIQQCLILRCKPFNSRAVNIVSFLNEVAVSIYLYLSLMLSDYLESQIEVDDSFKSSIRLSTAWTMTVILIFTIFMNFLFSLGNIGLEILKSLIYNFQIIF